MKKLILLLPVFVVLSFSTLAIASNEAAPQPREWSKGLITLGDKVPRYVEYLPAAQGQPTLVFANGLVYDLRRWKKMTDNFEAKGYGLLLYYFRGQHETLLAEVKSSNQAPAFFERGLGPQDFNDELIGILDHLKIQKKVVMVGLSYGAHIAARFAEAHPERIQKLVFLAPLVISLDRYDAQGAWILQNLEWLKLTWGPFLGPYFYEAAYRQIYQSYLNQRIVPERVPEELRPIAEEYRESVFHLVRAARDFDLRKSDFSKLPANSVSYLLATEEEQAIFDDQLKAARATATGRLQHIIHMPESSHAIPDSEGAAAAEIMTLLLQNDPRLKKGGASILKDLELVPWP